MLVPRKTVLSFQSLVVVAEPAPFRAAIYQTLLRDWPYVFDGLLVAAVYSYVDSARSQGSQSLATRFQEWDSCLRSPHYRAVSYAR